MVALISPMRTNSKSANIVILKSAVKPPRELGSLDNAACYVLVHHWLSISASRSLRDWSGPYARFAPLYGLETIVQRLTLAMSASLSAAIHALNRGNQPWAHYRG